MAKETLSTFRLNKHGNHREVLASVKGGSASPIGYGNRTQAKKRLGTMPDPSDWYVYGYGPFYVAKRDWFGEFAWCHADFKIKMGSLASVAGLDVLAIFKLWKHFEDAFSDQPALISEFVECKLADMFPGKLNAFKLALQGTREV